MHPRPASASDTRAIAGLHAASWRAAYRGILSSDFLDHEVEAERQAFWAERMANLAPECHVTFVIDGEARLDGFVCALINEDPVWGTLIDNLHVAPGLKGKGHGRALMRAAAEALRERGHLGPLFLWVFERNLEARGFYGRIRGLAAELTQQTESDGRTHPVVRYVWDSPSALLAGLVS